MADEFYRTYSASGSIDNQYAAVKMSSDSQMEVAGNNDKAVGIVQGTASDGEPATVKIGGISKAVFNESLSVGDYVTVSSNKGYLEQVDAADEHAVGMVIKSADTQGDVGKVVISPFEASSSDA